MRMVHRTPPGVGAPDIGGGDTGAARASPDARRTRSGADPAQGVEAMNGVPLRAKDAPSLAGLLPYHSIDPAGVFAMRDGSLGMAWFLDPVETEALEPSHLGALAARIEGLLGLLPLGSAAQFLLTVSRDVKAPL